MNGKINRKGWLSIQRKSEFKDMSCINVMALDEADDRMCGDWCPHFGEPEPSKFHEQDVTPVTYLSICQSKIILFESLTDERE